MMYETPADTKEKHYLYHGTPDKVFIPEIFDPSRCVMGLWLTDNIGTTLSYRKRESENEDCEVLIGGTPVVEVMSKFENLSYVCDPENRRYFLDICELAECLEIDWSLEHVIRRVVDDSPEKQKALEYILNQGVSIPGRTLIVEVAGALETSWAESSETYQKGIHVGVKERKMYHDGSFNYQVHDYSRVRIVGEML